MAGIVRDTFASASADRAASSVLGVASWRWPGPPGGVGAEDLRPTLAGPDAPWTASSLRGGLWFLVYVATQLGVEAATWTLGAI